MGNYDDMRDMQRREADPDYIPPTFAFTGEDLAEAYHDHGEDAFELLNEVMNRDMARYDAEVSLRLKARITYLEQILDDNGIEY